MKRNVAARGSPFGKTSVISTSTLQNQSVPEQRPKHPRHVEHLHPRCELHATATPEGRPGFFPKFHSPLPPSGTIRPEFPDAFWTKGSPVRLRIRTLPWRSRSNHRTEGTRDRSNTRSRSARRASRCRTVAAYSHHRSASHHRRTPGRSQDNSPRTKRIRARTNTLRPQPNHRTIPRNSIPRCWEHHRCPIRRMPHCHRIRPRLIRQRRCRRSCQSHRYCSRPPNCFPHPETSTR